MSERKQELSEQEVAAAVRARRIKTWGGVGIGAACVVLAVWLREQVVPLMLIACVGFGLADPGQIANIWKK